MLVAKRSIYHITHIDNLATIIATGGLLCDSRKHELLSAPISIAFENLKLKREQTLVKCGPRGYVSDYVPFHFAPRSPMLFTIYKGNVADRKESDIIYFISSVELTQKQGLQYIFCDGHPIMAFTTFFDNLNDLDKVDWNIMSSKYWNDVATDPDRKRRRQAEFLVHGFFPWNLVNGIVVKNVNMQSRVNMYIDGLAHCPSVTVKREWYYG